MCCHSVHFSLHDQPILFLFGLSRQPIVRKHQDEGVIASGAKSTRISKKDDSGARSFELSVSAIFAACQGREPAQFGYHISTEDFLYHPPGDMPICHQLLKAPGNQVLHGSKSFEN
jgi:hypothetical protein